MAGLTWEVLHPKRIARHAHRKLDGWAAPKDVILWVAGQLGAAGGTNAIVEYIGPGARTISATGKATIANMGAELGATTSVFPYDAHMAAYLETTGRADLVPLAEAAKDLLQPDPEAEANPDAHYDTVLRLDLSALEPHVVGPAFSGPGAAAVAIGGGSCGPRERLRRYHLYGADRQLHQFFL